MSNNILTLNPSIILKHCFALKWKVSIRIFVIFSILLIIGLLVFCIFQLNAKVSEGYLVKNYEKKLAEISKENQNLEIGSAEAGFLDNIMALADELNLEKAEKVHYIRVLEGKVVSK